MQILMELQSMLARLFGRIGLLRGHQMLPESFEACSHGKIPTGPSSSDPPPPGRAPASALRAPARPAEALRAKAAAPLAQVADATPGDPQGDRPISAREIRRVADYSKIALAMSKQQHLLLFAIYLQGAT
jgi:hypothetical protein